MDSKVDSMMDSIVGKRWLAPDSVGGPSRRPLWLK
jgi:hypothetical protein